MESMSVLDATFLHIEDGNNPMHIGSVAVLEGPAPAYGDLVRLISAKLPLVPRYRQKVRFALGGVGRPVWVEDPHFQVLYHIRHTALPSPGGRDELRNLAGRVFAQILDRSKPLWELWMVEGLEDGRWALISKVHHCVVDGVSATDLMTLIFDVSAEPYSPELQPPWTAAPEPRVFSVTLRSVADAVAEPVQRALSAPAVAKRLARPPSAAVAQAARLLGSVGEWARRSATSLNGPIGPHRRWSWAEASLDDVRTIRDALGGTVNDTVLAAITAGFRALLLDRGEDLSGRVVRTLVPVSVRSESERGAFNNRVSGLLAGLPVAITDPVERLEAISAQLSGLKESRQAVAGDALVQLAGFAPPMLMALGSRLAMRFPQRGVQTVTTNVPGPQSPLYVAGRKMVGAYPYVPIVGSVRIGIAIFSYCGRLFFGITGDYDTVPDIDVLRDGIETGMRELLSVAAPPPARRTRAAQHNGTRPSPAVRSRQSATTAPVPKKRRAAVGARNGRQSPAG